MLPVALLLIIATVAGAAAWRASAAVERRVSDRRAVAEVAEEIREHTRVRSFVESRLDAEVATGLALTLALAGVHRRGGDRVPARPARPPERGALRSRRGGRALGARAHVRARPRHPVRDQPAGLDRGCDRDRAGRRDRRDDPRAQPVDPRLPDRCPCGRLARHQHRQGDHRPGPARDRPGGGVARTLLPQRPLVDGRGVLRGAGAARLAAAAGACAERARGRGGRDRRRRRLQPRPARPPLALGRRSPGSPWAGDGSPSAPSRSAGPILRFGAPVEEAALRQPDARQREAGSARS